MVKVCPVNRYEVLTEYNQYAYYVYDAEGNRTRKNLQPAYMICTDEDLGIYEGTSMKQLKKME